MNIVASFAPFIIFSILNGSVSLPLALGISAVISAALIIRSVMRGASLKILEVGSVVLFAGLAVYSGLFDAHVSLMAVKLCVNIGLLAIVLVSIVIGTPFTVQYAKAQVPREHWNSPGFLRVNYVMSAVWGLSFLLTALADLGEMYFASSTGALDTAVVIGSMIGAMKFTAWYPDWVQKQKMAAQG